MRRLDHGPRRRSLFVAAGWPSAAARDARRHQLAPHGRGSIEVPRRLVGPLLRAPHVGRRRVVAPVGAPWPGGISPAGRRHLVVVVDEPVPPGGGAWLAAAAAVLAGSADLAAAAEAAGAPPGRVTVAPAVPDRATFRPAPPPPLGSPTQLVCPADVTWEAGHEYLLVALAELRARGHDARLTLSSVGPAVERARYTIADLGLGEAVELVDLCPAARRRRAIEASHVVVLPALRARPWPEVAEATLVGRPVVATREALGDGGGQGAAIVPARSPEALARALEGWCAAAGAAPDGPRPGAGRVPARAS